MTFEIIQGASLNQKLELSPRLQQKLIGQFIFKTKTTKRDPPMIVRRGILKPAKITNVYFCANGPGKGLNLISSFLSTEEEPILERVEEAVKNYYRKNQTEMEYEIFNESKEMVSGGLYNPGRDLIEILTNSK